MDKSNQKEVFYRARRVGPETQIENCIFEQIHMLFPFEDQLLWTAGSIPLGAGVPDIVIASFRPEIFALSNVDIPKVQLLAYLRAIRGAKADTIAERLREPKEILIKKLSYLTEVEIVGVNDGVYFLSDSWKDILPTITTIEVKVKDWKTALNQAYRNSIFSHYSYIAMPDSIAHKICKHFRFTQLGIGVLAVYGDQSARIIKQARKRKPKVWDYYYKLADLVVTDINGGKNEFHRQY